MPPHIREVLTTSSFGCIIRLITWLINCFFIMKNGELKETKCLSESDLDARSRILKAAIHLFALKGFRSVSVKEISSAAGTNTALLFYYFRNKRELYESIYCDARQNIMASLEKALEGKADALSRLDELIRLSLGNTAEDPDFDLLVSREFHGFGEFSIEELVDMLNCIIEPLVKIVSQGIKEGVFRKMDPRLAAISIIFSFHPFSKHPLYKKSEFTRSEIFQHVREMILGGILSRS